MKRWEIGYTSGSTLWRYSYVDVDGEILYQFESYIRRTISELESIYPEHDDILMEIVDDN